METTVGQISILANLVGQCWTRDLRAAGGRALHTCVYIYICIHKWHDCSRKIAAKMCWRNGTLSGLRSLQILWRCMKIHSYPFNVRHGLLELEHSGIFGYLGQTYISFVTCWKWQDCQDARVCYSKADHDSEQGSLALNIAVLGVTLRTCSIACLRPSWRRRWMNPEI